LTVRGPSAVELEMVMSSWRSVESRNVTEWTVIPVPSLTLAPGWKFEPRTSTLMVVPRAPEEGEVDVVFGPASMVRHPPQVAPPPPGFVTVTSEGPVEAFRAPRVVVL
jgi:hypothetical protein